MDSPDNNLNLIFFDGVCGLCSDSVDWVMARDREEKFRFSPLQGELAKKHLTVQEREELESLVVMKNGVISKRSSAVIEVLVELPGVWPRLALLLKLIPLPLRDLGYRIVAKIRYRIWGKKDFCRLPTPAERRRFID